jgi:hypothetical protein
MTTKFRLILKIERVDIKGKKINIIDEKHDVNLAYRPDLMSAMALQEIWNSKVGELS